MTSGKQALGLRKVNYACGVQQCHNDFSASLQQLQREQHGSRASCQKSCVAGDENVHWLHNVAGHLVVGLLTLMSVNNGPQVHQVVVHGGDH